jgi:N-acetylglucosaminyldiphosphoundecaprenol N-acetyl-beta-D-mannosaminyltransferase
VTASWPSAQLLGQQLALGTVDEVAQWLSFGERPEAFSYVVTANLAHLDLLRRSAAFRTAYRQASLRVIDGAPIVWLLRWWHHAVPERVAGADLVDPVLARLSARGGLVAIFGGRPGSEARIESAVRVLYPGLAGCRVITPPMGFNPTSKVAEDYAISLAEACADVDVLLLCLGAPKQELFASRWSSQLPAVRALCCGAAIDMLIGDVTRAPALLRRTGLEWLHRFLQEPRRLYFRYSLSALVFVRLLLGGEVTAMRLVTADNPRVVTHLDHAAAKGGPAGRGRRPRVRCLPRFRRTPHWRRPKGNRGPRDGD